MDINIKTNSNGQNKFKDREVTTWKWQGKIVRVDKMNIGQLEQCLLFIKNNKVKGNIFGKSKEYWKDVFNKEIKHKSNKNVNHIIKIIDQHKIKVITEKYGNYTINKTNIKL